MRRRQRLIVLLVSATIVVGLLTLVSPYALERLWRAVAMETLDADRVKQRLTLLCGNRLPDSLVVVDAVKEGGRDSSSWYELRLDPKDVQNFKTALSDALNRRYPNEVDDSDTVTTIPGIRRGAPRWWDPRRLPDIDVLRCPGWWIALSPSTGTVYVYRWEW